MTAEEEAVAVIAGIKYPKEDIVNKVGDKEEEWVTAEEKVFYEAC